MQDLHPTVRGPCRRDFKCGQGDLRAFSFSLAEMFSFCYYVESGEECVVCSAFVDELEVSATVAYLCPAVWQFFVISCSVIPELCSV